MSNRTVRMDEFKKQQAEALRLADSFLRVDLSDDEHVWIKMPVHLADDDDFAEQVQDAVASGDNDQVALVILGQHPDVSGEEQLKKWREHGHTIEDLAILFRSEARRLNEEAERFRYSDTANRAARRRGA